MLDQQEELPLVVSQIMGHMMMKNNVVAMWP